MSDFLLSTHPRAPGELRAHLARFLAPVVAGIEELHGAWGSLAIARAAHDDGPLVDADDAISAFAGDPLLHSRTAGTGLATAGARRAELHRLLLTDGPVAWDERVEGHFALLAVCRASGAGRVVTDAFAFVPVFHGTDRRTGALVVGTHVDATALACGRARDVDPVSAADLVANLTCTYPYTLYAGVRQLAPGTDHRFGRAGWTDALHTYWEPAEEPRFRRIDDAAEALREGFRASLAHACGEHAEVGLLMSGGEDSRAVLGAMPRELRVDAVTYAEWESREVRVARAAAARYGATLRVGIRGPRHYLDGFEAAAGIVGSGHLFVDVHGYGLHESLGLGSLPLVVGGLSSDSLLKGVYERRRGGAEVPVPAVAGVQAELLSEAARRRTVFRDSLAELRPQSADEWDTLWPFSMRKHGGNLDGNRRLFRSHEPYHATAVLRVAAAAPIEWKRHRRLFLRAMRPFLRPAWAVPHAEYRFPYFGRWGSAALLPVLAVARGARALATGEIRARHRPWPKWTRLAADALSAPGWSLAEATASPIGVILAEPDPQRLGPLVGGWYALQKLMLRQLAHVTTLARDDAAAV